MIKIVQTGDEKMGLSNGTIKLMCAIFIGIITFVSTIGCVTIYQYFEEKNHKDTPYNGINLSGSSLKMLYPDTNEFFPGAEEMNKQGWFYNESSKNWYKNKTLLEQRLEKKLADWTNLSTGGKGIINVERAAKFISETEFVSITFKDNASIRIVVSEDCWANGREFICELNKGEGD